MTINALVHLQPTTSQLEILHRADHLFRGQTGRYYGGQLTAHHVATLTNGVELKDELKTAITKFTEA